MAQSIRIKRTGTANNPPGPLSLAEGELAVEMNRTVPRLWVGVPTGIDTSGLRQVASDDIYLPLTGGTLTGPLQLDGRPLQINGDLTIDRAATAQQAIGAVNFSSGAQTRAVFQAVATDDVAGAAFAWFATPVGATTPRQIPMMALSANGDLALTALSNIANVVGLVSFTDQRLPPGYLTVRGRGDPTQREPVLENDVLGGFWCDGQFGSGLGDNTDSNGASINASAIEDWSATNTPSRWNIRGVARGERQPQTFATFDAEQTQTFGHLSTRRALLIGDAPGRIPWRIYSFVDDDGLWFMYDNIDRFVIFRDGAVAARGGAAFDGNLTVGGAAINFTSAGAHTIAFPGTVNTIAFNGATTNMITWPGASLAPPVAGAVATRSVGTRLVMYPNQVGGLPIQLRCDYALGMESGALWYAGANHRWYGETATRIMELAGTGNLNLPLGNGVGYRFTPGHSFGFGWVQTGPSVYRIQAWVDGIAQGYVQLSELPFDLRDRLDALEARLAAVEARRS
jgi:hypothetical protein